jgi:indolepyruvate ferredoxin oxidoreductase beta subunit
MTEAAIAGFPERPCNVLLAGIGGQGVLTAAQLLGEAALHAGHDIKKSEVHGMAQRGGVVTSHVRFGSRIFSPIIPHGAADVLLAFEEAEALRWQVEVRSGGRLLVNCLRVPPPVVNLGLFQYPEEPLSAVRIQGAIHPVEASAMAVDLGSPRLAGVILLGAAAAWLPLGMDDWEAAIRSRFHGTLADQNLAAFRRGRDAVAAVPGSRF